MRRPLAAVAVLATALLAAVPAHAHVVDPRVATVLDAVEPSAPAGVVVQVRQSAAAELVAENPTSTPLEVLDEQGRAFLRISARGVEADLQDPTWYLSTSPTGAVTLPQRVRPGSAPDWSRVAPGDSWGWFDHRLHPAGLTVPADATRVTRLAGWTVPLRYGGLRLEVRGHLELRPLLGTWTVGPPAPVAGISATVLPGRLPGLLLSDPDGVPCVVLGRDGRPFLRLGPAGVEVDRGSPSWADDRQARGLDVPSSSRRPDWQSLGAPRSVTWLDPRLAPPADPPADPSQARSAGRWSVPLLLSGRPALLSGDVTWVPAAGVRATAAAASTDRGAGLIAGACAAGGLLAAGVAAVTVRRRRSRAVR